MIARWGLLLSAAIAACAPLALAGCAFDATEDQATQQASHHEAIVATDDNSSSQNGNSGSPQPQPPQPEPSPWHTSPRTEPEPSPWRGAAVPTPDTVQGGQAAKSFVADQYLRELQSVETQR